MPAEYLAELDAASVSHPGVAASLPADTTWALSETCDAFTAADVGAVRTNFFNEGEVGYEVELRIDNWTFWGGPKSRSRAATAERSRRRCGSGRVDAAERSRSGRADAAGRSRRGRVVVATTP